MPSFIEQLSANPPVDVSVVGAEFSALLDNHFANLTLSQLTSCYAQLECEWRASKDSTVAAIKSANKQDDVLAAFASRLNVQARKSVLKEYGALYQKHQTAKFESDDDKAALELDVMQLHAQYLLLRGKRYVGLQKNQLQRIWHQDLFAKKATPAMRFMEAQLGPQHCFKLIDVCVERIEHPGAQNKSRSGNRPNEDEVSLKQFFARGAVHAPTYSERLFFKSLLSLFANMGSHSESVKDVSGNVPVARLALLLAPYASSAFCLSFLAPSIALGVLASKLVALGVDRVATAQSPETKKALTPVIAAANQVAYLVSTVPAMVFAGNFKVADALTSGVRDSISVMRGGEVKLISDPTSNIDAIPLRVIAWHLQQYIDAQAQQWGAEYRQGASKRILFQSAIQSIHRLNAAKKPMAKKLDETKVLLARVKIDPAVCNSGSGAIKALSQAEAEIAKAEKVLTSPEQRAYYDRVHCMRMPLLRYQKTVEARWLATWRQGSQEAKSIAMIMQTLEAVSGETGLGRTDRIAKMEGLLTGLRDEGATQKFEPPAMAAINAAIVALVGESSVPKHAL